MHRPCHKPFRWPGARSSKMRLHRLSFFAALILALLAPLIVASCGGSSTPWCTNCMLNPVDDEHGLWQWCASHFITPAASCTRIGFLFNGYVDAPNAPVTIEAKLPDSSSPNPWWKVPVVVTSDSKNGPPYGWRQWVNLDYNIWEVTQGPVPASVMYSASVRSKSPGGDLASFKTDKYSCHNAHPTTFLASCKQADENPVHITAEADFGYDAVSLINLIRRLEGVKTELTDFGQKESLADQDAKYNYEHGAHSHFEGMKYTPGMAPGGTSQNETDTYSTYDQILDTAIWLHMYVYEKQYSKTGTCDEPAICKKTGDGHYKTMISTAYTKVAPGIYVTPDKQFHAVLNFYP